MKAKEFCKISGIKDESIIKIFERYKNYLDKENEDLIRDFGLSLSNKDDEIEALNKKIEEYEEILDLIGLDDEKEFPL